MSVQSAAEQGSRKLTNDPVLRKFLSSRRPASAKWQWKYPLMPLVPLAVAGASRAIHRWNPAIPEMSVRQAYEIAAWAMAVQLTASLKVKVK